jgi:hypothetical protein
MTDEAARVIDLDPAKEEGPAIRQPMSVVSDANAHGLDCSREPLRLTTRVVSS